MTAIVSYLEPIDIILNEQRTVRDVYTGVTSILYDENSITLVDGKKQIITVETRMIKNFVVEDY